LQLCVPEDACVLADDVRLKQILHNLVLAIAIARCITISISRPSQVGNAMKFTQQGYIKVSAEPGPKPNTLTIKVADTGPGTNLLLSSSPSLSL
jgi:signal transduction histidine kinase